MPTPLPPPPPPPPPAPPPTPPSAPVAGPREGSARALNPAPRRQRRSRRAHVRHIVIVVWGEGRAGCISAVGAAREHARGQRRRTCDQPPPRHRRCRRSP